MENTPKPFRYIADSLTHPDLKGVEMACDFCGARTLPFSCVAGRMATDAGLVPCGDKEKGLGLVSLCRDCLIKARPDEEEEAAMDAYIRFLCHCGKLTPEQAVEAKAGLMCSHGNMPFFQQHLDWPVHQGCLCEFTGNPENATELRETLQKGCFWQEGQVRAYAGEYDEIVKAVEEDLDAGYLEGFLFFRSMVDGSLFWVFQYS